MQWILCFAVALIICVAGVVQLFLPRTSHLVDAGTSARFRRMAASVFAAATVLFLPIYGEIFAGEPLRWLKVLLLSVHNTIRLFIVDGEFTIVTDYLTADNGWIFTPYSVLFAALFVAAPLLTFGVVLKVRRIEEVRALINRILYEDGEKIFAGAQPAADGMQKQISALVVGLGQYGTHMLKSLSWFCQMDGYRIDIHAFDRDPLAYDKLYAQCPELLSDAYNGVYLPGEAQYRIDVRSGIDVWTRQFADAVAQLTDATYVLVALGSDQENVRAAVYLRMLFERMHIHPVIQTIVYSAVEKSALCGICNYRGQPYDIQFSGDTKTSYSEKTILDSALEADALARHLKWDDDEESFWRYEYNYRSSVATAIHMRARIACGIPGADKKIEDRTPAEAEAMDRLEHRRWNAYMRSEGYVYSGSPDKASRNDLAKMHHDLVDFLRLTEEEKRKDSRVSSV